jgi:Fe2+ or Zn2+ uptake regulation protein
MENKKMLKESVESLDRYTSNQCKVFNALVDLSVDNLVYASVMDLHKRTGVTRPTVYSAINAFQRDGIITKDFENFGSFKFQQDKIDLLLKLHAKKAN